MKNSAFRRSISTILCLCPIALSSAIGCGDTGGNPSSDHPLGGAGGASSDEGDGGSSTDEHGSGGRSTEDLGGATGSGGKEPACDGTECTCPDGTYWDAVAETCSDPHVCAPGEGRFGEECFICSPTVFCDGEGETGEILATTPEDDAACICETEEGYFPASEGSIAEPCDVDGDGWVTDRAQPSVESENPVVRANARCDVRRVRSILLENEAGNVFDISAEDPDESLTVAFPGNDEIPPGLPLYESSLNDADPGDALPLYQANGDGRRLTPREVNGLTKGCIGVNTDLNHNDIPDVSEWDGAELGRPFANAVLESYYEKYREFSYFLTLHDGFWEPVGQSGVYRIVERRRSSSGASSAVYEVPLEYPAGVVDTAYECSRHPDVSFFGTAGEILAPTIGGDFVRFTGASMLHHSQYKCIEIVSSGSYGPNTSASAPHLAYIESGKPFRKTGDEEIEENWTFNECWAEGSSPVGSVNNPDLPQIECRVQTSSPESGDVRWAAVRYQHYEDGYDSLKEPGGYVRACANTCADSNAAPNECWGCDEKSWGKPVPLGTDTTCGEEGKESCDGAGHCDGCIAGQRECKSAVEQWVCSEDREWTDNVLCQYGCYSVTGKCYPQCAPGSVQCSATGIPQKCSVAGEWVNQTACGETSICKNGGCANVDGLPCESDDDCGLGKCNAFYPDKDGDGYGKGSATIKACGSNAPAGASKNNSDCCDQDEYARPNQTGFFGAKNKCGSFDYNCDEDLEKAYTHQHACNCTGSDPGWIYGYPDCGESGKYGTCHQTSGTDCHPIGPGSMVQPCR